MLNQLQYLMSITVEYSTYNATGDDERRDLRGVKTQNNGEPAGFPTKLRRN
jgi:hypothetical protein